MFRTLDVNIFLHKLGQSLWGLTFQKIYRHYIMEWREYLLPLYNFLDTRQMVAYIYEEKRRTHAVGLSLSHTHESYVKAPLTNKP